MGLMPTKVEGVSHAMLGDPGRIGGWIQVEVGPSAIFGNPSLLLGVAGIMTQFARQQEVRELRNLLLKIDDKLDDVRRRQRDEVIAKMDRAATAIEEAMMIREYGGDCETAWAKVVDEPGTIAEVQANALRAIGALTTRLRRMLRADRGCVGLPIQPRRLRVRSECGWLCLLGAYSSRMSMRFSKSTMFSGLLQTPLSVIDSVFRKHPESEERRSPL